MYYVIGVFLVGAGDQGILYEHRESEWGDHANVTEIIEIINKKYQ
jgi:hypothetical protein